MNYSWEGSFAFVIMLICTRNLMLRITLIQAKSGNTPGDYSIQGKQHQNQTWRINWQITVSNGWARKRQPARKRCSNRVSPGKLVIQISCPAASFTQSFSFFPASLQLGPAFPSCLPGWSGLRDTRVCVCVCVCVCVLRPQGSQIPAVGDQELVQVFWSGFAKLGQSCVNSL